MRAISAGVILAAFATVSNGDYIETFSGDNSDWKASYINNHGRLKWESPAYTETERPIPDHRRISIRDYRTDDLHDGFISAKVPKGKGYRLYDLEPSSIEPYGDMTDMSMTVDFKMAGKVDGPTDKPMVRFYVGAYAEGKNDYFVTSDAFSWDPNGDADWKTHQVALLAENFIEWPNVAAYSRTFEQVIANPDDIGLVFVGGEDSFKSNKTLGFSSSHGAEISIDNFGTVGSGTVPEPATLSVIAMGALVMVVRGRKILD